MKIDSFLDMMSGGPRWMLRVQEILGYLIYADGPGGWFIYLHGPPQTGKSLFCHLVQHVAAPQPCCHLTALNFGRWEMASVLDSEIVIADCGLPPRRHESMYARLMGLIAGEDQIYETKNDPKAKMKRPRARWVIVDNEAISCIRSPAFRSRAIAMPFTAPLGSTMVGCNLLDTLREIDREASLPWIHAGWQRVQQNAGFTVLDTSKMAEA